MPQNENPRVFTRATVGWLLLLLAFMLTYLNRYALANIGTVLMKDFGIGASTLGLLFSSYSVAYSLAIIPSGLLVDQFGPRQVAIAGLLLGTIGGLLFSQSPLFELALAGRFIMALGLAVLFPAIMKAQRLWFSPQILASLTGVVVGAGNLASLVALSAIGIAVLAWGWHTALGLLAGASLAIAFMLWTVVRDRMHGSQLMPENLGRPVYGSSRWRGYVSQTKQVFQCRRAWTLFLAAVGVYGSLTSLVGVWGVPYLQVAYGLDALSGASYLQLLLLGATFGGPILGWLSDRFHRRRLLYRLGTGIIVIVWMCMSFALPSLWMVPVLFLLLGLAQGISSLGVTLMNEIQPVDLAGLASSMFTVGAQIGGALIPAAMGYVLDYRGLNLTGFQSAFILGLGGGLLSLLMTFFMPETQPIY